MGVYHIYIQNTRKMVKEAGMCCIFSETCGETCNIDIIVIIIVFEWVRKKKNDWWIG